MTPAKRRDEVTLADTCTVCGRPRTESYHWYAVALYAAAYDWDPPEFEWGRAGRHVSHDLQACSAACLRIRVNELADGELDEDLRLELR